jgi:hypothetical protein
VHRRAEQLYQQLDALVPIRRQARRELLTESQKHPYLLPKPRLTLPNVEQYCIGAAYACTAANLPA